MSTLLTNNFKLHSARQLLESISEQANTAYYLFVGDHVPKTNVATPSDSIRQVTIDSYRNMILGKRVSQSDANLMIRRIDYASNTVYDPYDDTDTLNGDKDFYCIVDEGSYYHIYKCLDNNFDQVSTSQPTFAHITGANSIVYQTSDGYKWKYMYSVAEATAEKFLTTNTFPVIANTTVQNNAIDGSIEIIKIINAGKRYDNYLTGSFSSADIRVDGNPLLYRISNTTINQTNGFYTGCLIYLSQGTGAGQYATVTDFYVNSNGNFIAVNSAFTTSPTNGTAFQIYPQVKIVGDGGQSVNAIARALINATSTNSVYNVEILERGAGYTFASANVVANTIVPITVQAEVRPIYGPPGGHGKDPASELYSKSICFSVKLANSESNTLVTTNGFQQIGILKDPLFDNVNIEISNTASGTFTLNERAYKVNPVLLKANVTVNTTSPVITTSSGYFNQQVSQGDYLYLVSGDLSSYQLATVAGINNTDSINISSNGLFSCTETRVYSANISSSGFIKTTNSTNIVLSNVSGIWQSNDVLIAVNSGARAVVNAISRNDVTKGFNTFIQMHKYVGTVLSNTFLQNENVYQGANLSLSFANASIHSVVADGGNTVLYTTNQVGSFVTSNNLYGANSTAVASITTIYEPELVFASGDVLFLRNVEKVTRTNNQSQTVKIVFDF